MELTPKQQTVELIRSAERILVVTHGGLDGDAIGSLLALAAALKKLGKDVAAATPEPIPSAFQFLPGADLVTQELCGTQDFIIELKTGRVAVERLGYKNLPSEQKLRIIITPQQGTFTAEDVEFGAGQLKYDLVVVLDSPEIDRLGQFVQKQAQLFYETPVINIDHHAGNTFFGKVNWVDLTATSTAEILVALLESLGRDQTLLDRDIATCLLAGITTDTESFQSTTTTPKSLTVAAQLVAAGARQQEIVQRIYRTKTMSTLRLWGKALSQIEEDKEHRFLWSKVSATDIKGCGADETELSGVANELLRSAPNIDFVLLLSERKSGHIHGSLRSVSRGVDVSEIAKLFQGGGGHLAAAFRIPNANLEEAEREVVDHLRSFQRKRLTTTPLAAPAATGAQKAPAATELSSGEAVPAPMQTK